MEVLFLVCIIMARFLLGEEVFWISWNRIGDLDFSGGGGGVLDLVGV